MKNWFRTLNKSKKQGFERVSVFLCAKLVLSSLKFRQNFTKVTYKPINYYMLRFGL